MQYFWRLPKLFTNGTFSGSLIMTETQQLNDSTVNSVSVHCSLPAWGTYASKVYSYRAQIGF